MPVLMCTRDLWRALGGKGALAKLEPTPPSATSRLGDWSATLVALRRKMFVLALNERTYMARTSGLRFSLVINCIGGNRG